MFGEGFGVAVEGGVEFGGVACGGEGVVPVGGAGGVGAGYPCCGGGGECWPDVGGEASGGGAGVDGVDG